MAVIFGHFTTFFCNSWILAISKCNPGLFVCTNIKATVNIMKSLFWPLIIERLQNNYSNLQLWSKIWSVYTHLDLISVEISAFWSDERCKSCIAIKIKFINHQIQVEYHWVAHTLMWVDCGSSLHKSNEGGRWIFSAWSKLDDDEKKWGIFSRSSVAFMQDGNASYNCATSSITVGNRIRIEFTFSTKFHV